MFRRSKYNAGSDPSCYGLTGVLRKFVCPGVNLPLKAADGQAATGLGDLSAAVAIKCLNSTMHPTAAVAISPGTTASSSSVMVTPSAVVAPPVTTSSTGAAPGNAL